MVVCADNAVAGTVKEPRQREALGHVDAGDEHRRPLQRVGGFGLVVAEESSIISGRGEARVQVGAGGDDCVYGEQHEAEDEQSEVLEYVP